MPWTVVVQVLHAGQDRTGDKTKPISLLLPSPVEERSNVPRHCYGISFQEMAALTEALKDSELAADNGLESEVIFCPRLEPFVEFDLQKDSRTCQGTNKDARAQAHHGEQRYAEDARYGDG